MPKQPCHCNGTRGTDCDYCGGSGFRSTPLGLGKTGSAPLLEDPSRSPVKRSSEGPPLMPEGGFIGQKNMGPGFRDNSGKKAAPSALTQPRSEGIKMHPNGISIEQMKTYLSLGLINELEGRKIIRLYDIFIDKLIAGHRPVNYNITFRLKDRKEVTLRILKITSSNFLDIRLKLVSVLSMKSEVPDFVRKGLELLRKQNRFPADGNKKISSRLKRGQPGKKKKKAQKNKVTKAKKVYLL